MKNVTPDLQLVLSLSLMTSLGPWGAFSADLPSYPGGPAVAGIDARSCHPLFGVWRITYHPNQSVHTYDIDRSGKVAFVEAKEWSGMLQDTNLFKEFGWSKALEFTNDWFLLFKDDPAKRVERLTLCADGRLLVEHFNPEALAGGRPDQIGIGVKVQAGKAAESALLHDTEGQPNAAILATRKALEEAPSKPAPEVMPLLVFHAATRGTFPDELRVGFDRRQAGLEAIKKVTGYEQWFRDRLRALLPPGGIERDTVRGRRIKLVAIPDERRQETRLDQYAIFLTLERLATDEAIRVLAEFLSDDRHTYEPGSDYGSPSLAQDAGAALAGIQRVRNLRGAPGNAEPGAWQQWWADNRKNYAPAAGGQHP
jgi:hypothetical protein